MPQSPRVTYIHYSKLPSIPLLGNLFYRAQSLLLQKGFINNIIFSRKNSQLQNKLVEKIPRLSTFVVFTSYKFPELLKNIKSEVVLDVKAANLEKLNKDALYNLMWSLVHSRTVTPRTRKALGGFLPESIPVKKTIVIPYNDSFDVVCDYIFQTAKVLANQGNIVYLIALANPISISKYLFLRRKEKSKRQEFFDKNNIIVINPLTLFPLRLTKLKLIEKINRGFTLLYTTIFIKRRSVDYLWCFDPADADIVKFTKGHTASIYDCVDYFSTLEPKRNRELKDKETRLIKSADFFFVNSYALHKTKGAIRKPDAVVPQGFDIEAFSTKERLTFPEKRELANLKKVFSKIPKPRVGFVGSLTYRIDFELILKLIRKMSTISFVFTDAFLPIPDDDRFVGTEELIDNIKGFTNTHFIPKTFSRKVIKEALENFDMGIIPYDISFDFNKYCYPMKLFEYFYVGLPVVSTPIEELKRFPEYVRITNDVNEWEQNISNLLSRPWPDKYMKEQRKLAEENSWENKVNIICKEIKELTR